jgi:hypothetical protein
MNARHSATGEPCLSDSTRIRIDVSLDVLHAIEDAVERRAIENLTQEFPRASCSAFELTVRNAVQIYCAHMVAEASRK